MNDKTKSLIGIIIIVILFIFFSYIIQKNIEFFKDLIGTSFLGMFLYVIIIITAIVVAPVSALPLLPIVSNLWGWVVAGILSAIGWSVGALIAFVIARKYGVRIVKKLIPLKKIGNLEKKVHKKHIFWSIVLLRMVFPIDIISYVLGLFSKIKTKKYILATVMGIVPHALILAYLGRMPFQYQIIAFLIIIIILLIGFIIKNKMRNEGKKIKKKVNKIRNNIKNKRNKRKKKKKRKKRSIVKL